jgi:hypothetical protein
VVQPERVAEESKRKQRPRALLIAATVGIFVVAAFTLGRLTAPEVEATGSTPTTEAALSRPTTTMDPADFRVVDIQQGPQVRWARSFGVEDMWPVALLEFDGLFYLVGNSTPFGSSGLDAAPRVFTSDDGVFWVERPHDMGETGFSIQDATHGGDSLMAIGIDGPSGEAVVWRSTDGLAWSKETLPLPRPLEEGETAFLNAAVSRGRDTYIFGGMTTDFSSATVRAPFGLTVFTARFDDLGMPDDVIDRMREGGSSDGPLMWRTDRPTGPWEVSEFDATWVDQASVGEDGTIVATGFAENSQAMWVSTDGTTWVETPLDDRAGPVVWRDGLLAAVDNGLGTADVATSADGSEWDSTGVADLLPDSLDWFVRPLAVGEAGVGLFATGIERAGSGPTFPGEAVLERDGYRLAYDFEEGDLTMSHVESGETVFTTDSFNPAVSAPASIDFSAGTVTFHDPDTQDPLVTFSLLEMEAAEQQVFGTAFVLEGAPRAFVWSRDGLAWSVQDTAGIMVELPVMDLLITDDRMIAVTAASLLGASTPPTVDTWLGLIPSG